MATTYEQKKSALLHNINMFILNDDLFNLADAEIIINDLLRQQRFPKREYKEWLKKRK